MCDLTKFMIAIPTKDCSALTTAECLFNNILFTYNFPSKIISDNASNFNSKVIHELLRMLRIKKPFVTPYHPQANIAIEHRTLNAYSRAFASKNMEEWHDLLKFAMFAYNNSVHSVTGYTPHELAHGFKIRIPNHLSKPKLNYNYDNLADNVKNTMASTLEIAREHLMNRKLINKKFYDQNTRAVDFKIGDMVLMRNQTKKGKFDDVYNGPFQVTDTSESYVEILRNGKRQRIHKNLLKISNANDQ